MCHLRWMHSWSFGESSCFHSPSPPPPQKKKNLFSSLGEIFKTLNSVMMLYHLKPLIDFPLQLKNTSKLSLGPCALIPAYHHDTIIDLAPPPPLPGFSLCLFCPSLFIALFIKCSSLGFYKAVSLDSFGFSWKVTSTERPSLTLQTEIAPHYISSTGFCPVHFSVSPH